MLNLAREVEQNCDAIEGAVMRALRSGQFVGGPEVEAFERDVAERLGVRHAVALNSGTDALVLALEGLGVGPGHDVITTPFSFFATVEAIVRVGATPVFADIDPVTLNLDAAAVERALTHKTKALLPVHLFGLPAPMAALRDLADAHNLVVLEDAAQAFGARYTTRCLGCDGACGRDALHGRSVGNLADAAAFSFYPTKTLGAYGDAGMVTTSNEGRCEVHARHVWSQLQA
jgi:dTDP-4-amino-4,6-dideoxygalactose transaminase